MEQGGLFRKYALDSSFLLDLWTTEGSHAKDVHVGLWRHFEEQVARGEIVAPFEVREELTNSYDKALDRWLVKHKQLFVGLSRPQLDVLTSIVRAYPDFTRGRRNMADPAVVSLAAADALTVLTSEHHKQNPSPTEPKIPNLCASRSVSCLGINDYMRSEGLVQT